MAAAHRTAGLPCPTGSAAVAGSTVADVEVNCAKDSFWNGTCRELIAQDIGRWFFDLGLAPWPKGRPPRFSMSPTATGVFRVEPQQAPA